MMTIILDACYIVHYKFITISYYSVALLTVLAQRGFFQNACTESFEGDSLMQITEHVTDGPSLEVLFAEAVKGPLLSSDCQVQIATMNLIFRYLSSEDVSEKLCQVFIEENMADYIFEILRLSGKLEEHNVPYTPKNYTSITRYQQIIVDNVIFTDFCYTISGYMKYHHNLLLGKFFWDREYRVAIEG